MRITINDPELLKQLQQADSPVEFCDPDGNVVVWLKQPNPGSPPPGFVLPYTEEEIAERSKVRHGRSLKDILRDLEDQHGPA